MKIVESKYDGLLASFYDADHSWRDYPAQVALVASLYPQKEARKRVKVLDLCCGSGAHALRLARHGFQVTGVDISTALLRQAKRKAKEDGLPIVYRKQDIFSLMDQGAYFSKFECATLLGWTLNINPIFEKLPELLKNVFKILKIGGFFILDLSLGLESHKVSSQPLRYELSSGLKGTLRIHEKANLKKRLRFLSYHWSVSRGNGSKSHKEMNLTANEALAIIQPDDIFSIIKMHDHQFEVYKKCRDYRLEAPYRDGDDNMVLVLRKKRWI